MYTGDVCPVCQRGAARHDEQYAQGMACKYCFCHIEELIRERWGGIPKEWQDYYIFSPGKPDFRPSKEDLYMIARYRAEVPYEIAEARKKFSGIQLEEQEELIKENAKKRERGKIEETCKRVDKIRANIQKRIDEEEECRKIAREIQAN